LKLSLNRTCFYILQNFMYFLFRSLYHTGNIAFKVLALGTLRGDFDATIECIPPLIIDCACIVKLTNLVCNTEKVCRRS